MEKSVQFHPADLVGFGRLAADATAGVTGLTQAVHRQIACRAVPPRFQALSQGIAGLVYSNIHLIGSLVNAGLQSATFPAAEQKRLSPRREAVVAAFNGVVGDYLVRTENPLAIPMSIRHRGRALVINRQELLAAISKPTAKVLVLVHGLCMNDLQWRRKGHDHGAALARDVGYTPVYLHYNSGQHVSQSGRLFASTMEALVEQWPVKVRELSLLAHSMGGLVTRSACWYGTEAGHQWPSLLRRLIFLGTPHHGAHLEQLGSWVENTLRSIPCTLHFARIGQIRSAGITDMRYGNLVDEDWEGQDRFALAEDRRKPVPLPSGVDSYAIAGSTEKVRSGLDISMLSDGYVAVDSALGHHPNPDKALGLSDSHQWVGHGVDHMDLLSSSAVYKRIHSWFGNS